MQHITLGIEEEAVGLAVIQPVCGHRWDARCLCQTKLGAEAQLLRLAIADQVGRVAGLEAPAVLGGPQLCDDRLVVLPELASNACTGVRESAIAKSSTTAAT